MATTTLHTRAPCLSHAVVGTLLGLWALTVLALAAGGVFAVDIAPLPAPLLLALLLPLTAFALAWHGSTAVRNYVAALDVRFVILLHSWRMLGLGFVFLHAHQILPGLFALPAGIGDALVALGASALAAALYSGRRVSRRTVLAWNTFGILDFVIAVTAGVLSRSPVHATLGMEVSSAAMTSLPLAMIPTFVVPLYLITHAIVWLHYRDAPRAAGNNS